MNRQEQGTPDGAPRERADRPRRSLPAPRQERVPWLAVVVFVVISFGAAWLLALPMWGGGGLTHPLAMPLIQAMMFTPALAAIVVTFVFRTPPRGERMRGLGVWPLRPFGRTIWLTVAALVLPVAIIVATTFLAGALGLARLDLTMSGFEMLNTQQALAQGIDPATLPPVQVIVLLQLVSLPLGVLATALFTFGEELGWRGWLLPALRPLGVWPSLLASGAVWGLWHAPVILLGYNFDRADVVGVLLMVAGCMAWGAVRVAASAHRLGVARRDRTRRAQQRGELRPVLPHARLRSRHGARRPARRGLVDRAGRRGRSARRLRAVPSPRAELSRGERGRGVPRAAGEGDAGSMTASTPQNWNLVDEHLAGLLVGHDAALETTLASQRRTGMRPIEVAPLAGKLLSLLVRISGARRVLEIGTLAGYSAIWMARALPQDGRLVTIEAEPAHAAVARANLEAAGIAERVDVREGRAAEVLSALDGQAPFDLVFIDADKESNTIYLDHAARLGRAGTVVVVDNVVRSGEVADAETRDEQILGVQAGLRMLRDDPRFDATALQTVGVKGWDGFALAVVL
jgi:predicted O-methyltransferase YrrM/membrane protease YdiL (CAAX protease family)